MAVLMHRRLLTITAMRDELLLGEIDAAKLLAADLAHDLRSTPKPDGWTDLIAPMVSTLDQAQGSDSVEDMAPLLAQLAVGCGSCHRTLNAPVELPKLDPSAPTADDDRMQQHLWAADRMWEGLIGPSSDRWVRGTTTFAVLPRCEDESDEHSAPIRLCARVQSLVRHGHVETTLTGQGDVYGRLLTTCAACHGTER